MPLVGRIGGTRMNKILLIEDNEKNANLIQKILHHRGYEVTHAPNALDGMRMAKQEQPSLILLDIGLPDLDGKVVASYFKGIARMRHIPIIAVTADTSAKTKRLAVAFGCEAVIHKPIDTRTFPEQIATYLATVEVS